MENGSSVLLTSKLSGEGCRGDLRDLLKWGTLLVNGNGSVGTRLSGDGLDQGSANISCEGLSGKDFRLHGPYGLSHTELCLIAPRQPQAIEKK